jgi:AcrR family transcriptional regulator
VRELSGASTGSIYHHFGDKEGLAAALYIEAMRDVLYAVLLVTAQVFTRSLLGGRSKTSMTTAERSLGDAAWRALRSETDDEDG